MTGRAPAGGGPGKQGRIGYLVFDCVRLAGLQAGAMVGTLSAQTPALQGSSSPIVVVRYDHTAIRSCSGQRLCMASN